jgi:hypothetical protein
MSITRENDFVVNGEITLQLKRSIYADKKLDRYEYLSGKTKHKGRNLDKLVMSEVDCAINLARAKNVYIRKNNRDGYTAYALYFSDEDYAARLRVASELVFRIAYVSDVYKNCFLEKLESDTMLYMSCPVHITCVEEVISRKML